MLAAEAGLEATFLTQFFFEAQPFLEWVAASRAAGTRARLVGGLAGPAGIATLFKFAIRCGVGPSIRALGARPVFFRQTDRGAWTRERHERTGRCSQPCRRGFRRSASILLRRLPAHLRVAHRVANGQDGAGSCIRASAPER